MILQRSISDAGDGRLRVRLKPRERPSKGKVRTATSDPAADAMESFLSRADVHAMIVDGALAACSDA